MRRTRKRNNRRKKGGRKSPTLKRFDGTPFPLYTSKSVPILKPVPSVTKKQHTRSKNPQTYQFNLKILHKFKRLNPVSTQEEDRVFIVEIPESQKGGGAGASAMRPPHEPLCPPMGPMDLTDIIEKLKIPETLKVNMEVLSSTKALVTLQHQPMPKEVPILGVGTFNAILPDVFTHCSRDGHVLRITKDLLNTEDSEEYIKKINSMAKEIYYGLQAAYKGIGPNIYWFGSIRHMDDPLMVYLFSVIDRVDGCDLYKFLDKSDSPDTGLTTPISICNRYDTRDFSKNATQSIDDAVEKLMSVGKKMHIMIMDTKPQNVLITNDLEIYVIDYDAEFMLETEPNKEYMGVKINTLYGHINAVLFLCNLYHYGLLNRLDQRGILSQDYKDLTKYVEQKIVDVYYGHKDFYVIRDFMQKTYFENDDFSLIVHHYKYVQHKLLKIRHFVPYQLTFMEMSLINQYNGQIVFFEEPNTHYPFVVVPELENKKIRYKKIAFNPDTPHEPYQIQKPVYTIDELQFGYPDILNVLFKDLSQLKYSIYHYQKQLKKSDYDIFINSYANCISLEYTKFVVESLENYINITCGKNNTNCDNSELQLVDIKTKINELRNLKPEKQIYFTNVKDNTHDIIVTIFEQEKVTSNPKVKEILKPLCEHLINSYYGSNYGKGNNNTKIIPNLVSDQINKNIDTNFTYWDKNIYKYYERVIQLSSTANGNPNQSAFYKRYTETFTFKDQIHAFDILNGIESKRMEILKEKLKPPDV